MCFAVCLPLDIWMWCLITSWWLQFLPTFPDLWICLSPDYPAMWNMLQLWDKVFGNWIRYGHYGCLFFRKDYVNTHFLPHSTVTECVHKFVMSPDDIICRSELWKKFWCRQSHDFFFFQILAQTFSLYIQSESLLYKESLAGCVLTWFQWQIFVFYFQIVCIKAYYFAYCRTSWFRGHQTFTHCTSVRSVMLIFKVWGRLTAN